MESPFRDEVETLRRENARLRADLAASRRPRAGLGLAVAAIGAVAAQLLRPWLNGSSDVRFWGAAAILVSITLAAAWATVGYKQKVS
jgi:hypothetical protein